MKLKQKALEWEEWHGTWLEATLNEFFDTCPVQVIKSEILHHILEDEITKNFHMLFLNIE